MYYDSEKIPEWKDRFFVATLRGAHVMMLHIEDEQIISTEKIFVDDYGRIRQLIQSPDGDIFMLTSNGENDKILQITDLQTTPLTVGSKQTEPSSTDLWIYAVILGIIIPGGIIAYKKLRK